jgi:phospholipid-binding lipoprotein MlaA
MQKLSDFSVRVCLIGTLAFFPPFVSSADNITDPDFDLFGDEYASGGSATESRVCDPLIGCNRVVFKANDFLYLKVVEPAARAYEFVVPEGARIGVKRFFQNLGGPGRVVNSCLQCKFHDAGTETKRFVINSSMGVLGFGDPALKRYGLKPVPEDFGQTLAVYGIGDGPVLELPLLGPSNLRDALAKIPDYFLSPVSYLDPWEFRTGLRVYEIENNTSLQIGQYGELKEAALDPYTFFRDAYKQNRDKRIEE